MEAATEYFEFPDEKLISQQPGFRPEGGLEARSPAFQAGGPLPRTFSAEGENISPPVIWSDLPADTAELVLICEDPNAITPLPYVHWIVYGISPDTKSIPAAIENGDSPAGLKGAKQGRNSKDQIGYAGAMPPRGHGLHHYHFQLFALDKKLSVPEKADRKTLVDAMKGHVIACAVFIGTYERK